MEILNLVVKKKWFDLIASGQKIEEYREHTPYWEKRILRKRFDIVRFRNGYQKNAPTVDVEWAGSGPIRGEDGWDFYHGEEEEIEGDFIVVLLGEVLSRENYERESN